MGNRRINDTEEFNDVWSTTILGVVPDASRGTPPNPEDNDVFRISDPDNLLSPVNKATLKYNGTDKIAGLEENLELDEAGINAGFIFTTGKGWRLFT